MNETLLKFRVGVRYAVRKFIPKPLRDRAKAVVGTVVTVLTVLNNGVFDFDPTVTTAINVILAVAAYLGIGEIPNVPVEDAPIKRGKKSPSQLKA